MKTLVCFSGGIDSAVVLEIARKDGPVEAVLFDYGQPHAIELEYARRLADTRGVHHRTVLLNHIPRIDDVVFAGRNLVMASVAVAMAAAAGFDRVGFGCNASDWDRFPDCRPTFWAFLDEIVGNSYGVRFFLPLLRMTKAQVIGEARRFGVFIPDTWSCYAPMNGEPCGVCLACRTRAEAGA